MFTDIVGYSTMMGNDESDAIKKAKIHEDVVRKKTDMFQGKLVQIYGDGSLTLFPSAKLAVRCAKTDSIGLK